MHTWVGSILQCSCHPGPPHVWEDTQTSRNGSKRLNISGGIIIIIIMWALTFWCTLSPRRTVRWSRRCGGPGAHSAPRVAPGCYPATGRGWHPAGLIHWLRRSAQTFFYLLHSPLHTPENRDSPETEHQGWDEIVKTKKPGLTLPKYRTVTAVKRFRA